MKRKTINGTLFQKMVESGTNNLRNNSDKIDQLNVFPVPDGDTGTNMSLTMKSGFQEIQAFKSDSISEMSKKLSRGLLMGARGNSGVILSQIFRGIADGFAGLSKATAQDLAKAFAAGVTASYKAVMTPVEGTILTVSREASEALTAAVTPSMTIGEALNVYIAGAEKSLEGTPDLLPALKEAGVVDSGGAGYLEVLIGMRAELMGTPIQLHSQENVATGNAVANADFNTEFPFCTEFIVELDEDKLDVEEKEMAKRFEVLGDSLVCVKDGDIVKIHVHTKNPGIALNIGQEYGDLVKMKIENMKVQHNETIGVDMSEVAPTKKEETEFGIISVLSGSGLKKQFKEIGCHLIIDGGQTMNPSTEDFVNAIKDVKAKKVIIIPNNSNVRLSAQQAADLVTECEVRVLPAKTISQGYASLIMFDETMSLDENVESMTEAIKAVTSGEVTYAVRDIEMNGVQIHKDDFIGIMDDEIVVSTKVIMDTTKQLISKMIDDSSEICTIFTGADVPAEQIKELENYIKENYKKVELDLMDGGQEIYSFIIGVE